jgi:hypothetical protein
MASGDIFWFDQGLLDLGLKLHNLRTDTIRLGIVTGAVEPVAALPDPRWGAGGATNLLASAVVVGGSYSGPIALTGVTWTLTAGVPTFMATSITIGQHENGFTNARWGIFYNDTDSGKRAFAALDLGSERSIVSGPLALNWNVGGILTIDQA